MDLDADKGYITTMGYVVMELDKEDNEKLCKDLTSGCNHFYDVPNQSYCHPYKHIDNLRHTLTHNHVLRSHKKRQKANGIKKQE